MGYTNKITATPPPTPISCFFIPNISIVAQTKYIQTYHSRVFVSAWKFVLMRMRKFPASVEQKICIGKHRKIHIFVRKIVNLLKQYEKLPWNAPFWKTKLQLKS